MFRTLTVHPAGQLHWPLFLSQSPPFWHSHFCRHWSPCLPTGHSCSHLRDKQQLHDELSFEITVRTNFYRNICTRVLRNLQQSSESSRANAHSANVVAFGSVLADALLLAIRSECTVRARFGALGAAPSRSARAGPIIRTTGGTVLALARVLTEFAVEANWTSCRKTNCENFIR